MEGESDPRFSGQKLQEQLLRHTVLAKANGSVSVRMLFQLELSVVHGICIHN